MWSMVSVVPAHDLTPALRGLMKEPKKWELRLMNAFQLVKNGKQIGYLKFDEFAKLMDQPHDHNGEPLNKEVANVCACGVEVIDVLGRNKSKECSWCGGLKSHNAEL